jgi:hypothetical protein
MVKYIIEGNIDFYEELYKSIGQEEEIKEPKEPTEGIEQSNEDKQEPILCLISNMPLTENFVKLECGHKFNYIPLYNDILNHKKKFNIMEHQSLKNIEIRCPYCRKVQQELLPYHKYPGVKEVHGVNYFDPTVVLKNQCACCAHTNMTFITGKCEYVLAEEGEECPNTSVLLLDQNKKYYCLYHKYKMSNDLAKKLHLDKIAFKKKQIEEEKQKKLDEKMKAKDDAKQAKEKLKEINKKAKEDANNAKNANKVNKTENVVLSIMCCTQILKKGGTCKQKQHTGTLCLKHHNITIAIDANC